MPRHFYLQAVDTSTPSGRVLFGMLGIFSEFERDIIVDWVKWASAARTQTVNASAASGSGEATVAVFAELAQGTSLRTTAKRCSVSLKTVQRIKAAA